MWQKLGLDGYDHEILIGDAIRDLIYISNGQMKVFFWGRKTFFFGILPFLVIVIIIYDDFVLMLKKVQFLILQGVQYTVAKNYFLHMYYAKMFFGILTNRFIFFLFISR